MSAVADVGGSSSAAPAASFEPQPETVDALLSATVRVIEDERARGDTADTKAGQLVGFTGVILAVEASLGSNVFDHGISGRELVSEEQRNNRKLDVVSRAGLLLLVGVVALAGEGGTLAIEHLAMSTSKQQSPPPAVPPRSATPSVLRPKPPKTLPLGLVKKGGSKPPEVRK